MALVSVIIPTYNAEKTILETIESVISQTIKDIEILVIDDGCSDRTLEILSTIKDPRLKVFSYKNGGLPTARNRGIEQAKGDFISFIDADDLWTKDKLELQLAALANNPHAKVAYSWTVCMQHQGNKVFFTQGSSPNFAGDVYADLLLVNFVASGSNILVRRDAIDIVGNFKPELQACEDWDFYLRLAASFNFVVVPKNQIIYRRLAGSMSSKVEIMESQGLSVLNLAFKSAPLHLQPLKNESLANFYRSCAELNLNYNTKFSEAWAAQKRLQTAILLYPKVLLETYTCKLFLKSLLQIILPASFTNILREKIEYIKIPFRLKDPRII